MQAITTIGLDIAKSVFQIHGVDANGQVVLRRQLKRRFVLAFFEKLAPCLVGIEACASSHHWARQLQALGHNVRLMPPAYVKPYVKRQKNDATDAEAICEAVSRASMRFVPAKTPEQQGGLVLHRTRHLFIRQQTSVINAIRAHCAEFGLVAPVGRRGVEELLSVIANAKDEQVPAIARACVAALGAQLHRIKQQILEFDRMITAWHRCCETSRRLDEIPGVGPALATALVASVANPRAFRSGRDFSAWIGLVPKQNSSGGKPKLGSISKQGNIARLFHRYAMTELARERGMSESIAALFQRLTQGVYVVGVAYGEVRNAFTAAWVMQVSYDPLLLALSINPNHSSYLLLKEGRSFSVNVLKKGQLDLADHFGRSDRADKLALTEWTTDRIGVPLLREVLAWFECQVVSEHPAGDHVLVLGKVIDGKLLDSEAEPMCYRETGAMDGASTLYPDVLGES